jgi:hypothetical protein
MIDALYTFAGFEKALTLIVENTQSKAHALKASGGMV